VRRPQSQKKSSSSTPPPFRQSRCIATNTTDADRTGRGTPVRPYLVPAIGGAWA
jgi:hypothetical protein